MSRPAAVIVLAAGQGTRMKSALPKVVHPLSGLSMIGHALRAAHGLDPQHLVAVVRHQREVVATEIERVLPSAIIADQDEIPGTGRAVQCGLEALDQAVEPVSGTIVVTYGDVPLLSTDTLAELVATHEGAGHAVTVLTSRVDDPTGYGRIIRNSAGSVCAIVEEKDADAAQKTVRETNTGILVLPNQHLSGWLNALQNTNAQGEYYLTDTIALATADGISVQPLPVRAHHLAAGVNNKSQLAALERIYQQNQAEALMAQGATLRDPARFDLRGSLKIGQDVEIDANCLFEGDCILGDDVKIGANCIIRNALIGTGTTIAPFSHLDGCTIGAHAQIGPFARLRPGTALADGVHIGNFVEIKNSTLGAGSKANHLSYIGDARIGHRTNIGAGSITCNYDGAHKHQTNIGDDVFIGSNNSLVAPVHIGSGATTAAGSTITQDCEAGKLTLARARQITLDGWTRPQKNK